MLKIENTEVLGWEHAIRGMRNPMNSWEKSDSSWRYVAPAQRESHILASYFDDSEFWIGPNDADLMSRLRNAGTDHRKFMRMITVYVDLTAPLYWWKEYDTYKVATVANSTSTMHKIHSKPFSIDDFSHDHMTPETLEFMNQMVEYLEKVRNRYLETKSKDDWYDMIQLLPSSYNQMRTCTMNYESLINMYFARRNHKLAEWHTFCDWIMTLPYAKELIAAEEDEEA